MRRKGRNEEGEDSSSSTSENEDVQCRVMVVRNDVIEEEASKVGGCRTFQLRKGLLNGITALVPIL